MATKKPKVYKTKVYKPKTVHVAGVRTRKKPLKKRISYRHLPKGFTL